MVRHGMSTEQGMPSCTCMTMPVATGVRLEASCFDLQLPDGRLEGGEAPEALCDERFQTSSGRVQVAAQELLGAVMPPVAAVPGPSLALDGTGSPAPPVQTQPSAGMAERAPKMFVVGAAAPQASDIGVVATEPTGAMAKEAHAVAHAWSKEEINAFSRTTTRTATMFAPICFPAALSPTATPAPTASVVHAFPAAFPAATFAFLAAHRAFAHSRSALIVELGASAAAAAAAATTAASKAPAAIHITPGAPAAVAAVDVTFGGGWVHLSLPFAPGQYRGGTCRAQLVF